jgi:hypothetical protein
LMLPADKFANVHRAKMSLLAGDMSMKIIVSSIPPDCRG